MRTLTIFRKTVGDVAHPYVIAGYFVPLLTISIFFAIALSGSPIEPEGATLATQIIELHAAFAGTAFFISVGVPLLGLAAVFPALTLAREAEAGTLKLLLSKPVRRWQYYFGTFLGVTAYGALVGLVSLLLMAVLIVELSGVSTAAIEPAIFDQLLADVVYALLAVVVVGGVGFGLAVRTQDRLRTALGALVIPALFFAFLPIRTLSGSSYTDYSLYLVDVNYHFGHLYVFLHEIFGEIPVETEAALIPWTGVYEPPSENAEALPASLDLAGHVPMELSVLLLLVVGLGGLVVGLLRFRSMDV